MIIIRYCAEALQFRTKSNVIYVNVVIIEVENVITDYEVNVLAHLQDSICFHIVQPGCEAYCMRPGPRDVWCCIT